MYAKKKKFKKSIVVEEYRSESFFECFIVVAFGLKTIVR